MRCGAAETQMGTSRTIPSLFSATSNKTMFTGCPTDNRSVPCLIPESEIKAFVGQLKNRDTQAAMTRLLVVAFAAIDLMQSRCAGKRDETKLLLIKHLAREDKNKRYRRMMDKIVAALDSDEGDDEWMKGFGSACMTIARAFEYAGESLPDSLVVRSTYEQRVEQLRQACTQ